MIHPLFEQAATVESLEDAPRYFPLANGRYEVKPGMFPFGTDFGNGQADQQVFQFDRGFAHYRQVKLRSRAERLSKYYQTSQLSDQVAGTIVHFMIQRLTQEHPHHFGVESLSGRRVALHCQRTQEILFLDQNGHLEDVKAPVASVTPPYASVLDAIASQIQEDLAVVCRNGEQHWVSAIHLCYPNHWSAEEKIGKDFSTVHAPVAGMERINQRGSSIIDTMITRRPTVRFSWGLSTDTRLNHHPDPPSNIAAEEWYGRRFDPGNPHLYLRIERQVTWGFPEQEAALFAIRGYFRDCCLLKQDDRKRSQLASAIASMSTESLNYKGLMESKDKILAWLNQSEMELSHQI